MSHRFVLKILRKYVVGEFVKFLFHNVYFFTLVIVVSVVNSYSSNPNKKLREQPQYLQISIHCSGSIRCVRPVIMFFKFVFRKFGLASGKSLSANPTFETCLPEIRASSKASSILIFISFCNDFATYWALFCYIYVGIFFCGYSVAFYYVVIHCNLFHFCTTARAVAIA